VHELGSDSRVDTTANSSDDLTLLSTDFPDTGDLLGDKGFLLLSDLYHVRRDKTTHHAPSGLDLTDVLDESSNNLLSFRAVGDFRVELNTVDRFCFVGDSSVRGSRGGSNGGEVGWERRKLIAMAHPDLG